MSVLVTDTGFQPVPALPASGVADLAHTDDPANLDLAGQARGWAHIEGEIEHVFFHAVLLWQFVHPGRIDIDMAGGAGNALGGTSDTTSA
jgi:hypothetical protein